MPDLLQRRRSWPGLLAGLVAIACAFPLIAADKNPVIVHEWGTFTSLEDEHGDSIGGINVDDEPVPIFVDGDGGQTVIDVHSSWLRNFGLPPYWAGKGWAANDPAVTMRLETPVLYIYPPKGRAPRSVPPLDVHVAFHGGVLSQFFPMAKFEGAGLIPGTSMHSEVLQAGTTTSLTWSGVRLGSTHQPVETDDRVWTTPREVSAPLLEVTTHSRDAKGAPEDDVVAEHFLFYRGVGHLDSPLHVRDHLAGSATFSAIDPDIDARFPCWAVEIRPNGSCAFRAEKERAGMVSFSVPFFPSIPSSFADADFSAANLTKLQNSMQEELVKQGLYPDEASAMLRTWELSYFQSPGRRLFYIAPRFWVEKVLPLQVTGAPVVITRVMVGRIELISNAQKAALAQLAAGPCPDLEAVKAAARRALAAGKYSVAQTAAFYRGDRPLSELGIAIPPLVQDYLDLGRFRDVLILREQKLKPSPALAEFIHRNALGEQASESEAPKPTGVAAANR